MTATGSKTPVAVLGSGTMAAQIALSFAAHDHPVQIWGRRDDPLAAALERIRLGQAQLHQVGLVASLDPLPISVTTDMAVAVAGAGFVIEAVTEDVAIKADILCRAEREAPADAVLSSTTSALGPTDIQAPLARPERFVVAHFAQPGNLMRLVEVVPGAKTSDDAVARCSALLTAIGKLPVLCPDIPGFLWARIQHAILREFASLVGKGLTTPEMCDLVLKEGYSVRLPAMGCFEHADLAGLDLMNSPAARRVWADLSTVSGPEETPVGALWREGHRGMASGRGFYDWKERDPVGFREARDQTILNRLRSSSDASPKPTPAGPR